MDIHTLRCNLPGAQRAGVSGGVVELRYQQVRDSKWVSSDDATVQYAQVPSRVIPRPSTVDSGMESQI